MEKGTNEYRRRLDICADCPINKEGVCTFMRRRVDEYVRDPHAYCPLYRW